MVGTRHPGRFIFLEAPAITRECRHIYAYADETGQDPVGGIFLSAIVVVDSDSRGSVTQRATETPS